jgi:hypothetical protein
MGKRKNIPNKNEKLIEIFKFISKVENRVYNQQIQLGFIETWIGDNNLQLNKKVLNLLYNIFNTQSQPNIEKGADFFKKIHKNPDYYKSFYDFCKFISGNQNLRKEEANFQFAFQNLKELNGWGEKTSSLFLKVIYEVHNGRFIEYSFWDDVPNKKFTDRLYLPVDQVIDYIFKVLYEQNTDLKFESINNILYENYKNPEEILIWDDLWFWGYITQQSYKEENKNKRKFVEFNEAKYWTLLNSNKDDDTIKITKIKAIEFLNLILKK